MVLDYLRGLGDAVGPWLYLIAGGLAFAEAAVMIGVVLPGETALLLTFSSPLVPVADALAELFEAVAGTVRWS